jgi:hypothetical protein
MENNLEAAVKLATEATESALSAHVFYRGGFRKLGLEVAGEAFEIASKAYEAGLNAIETLEGRDEKLKAAYALVWIDALRKAIAAREVEYAANV